MTVIFRVFWLLLMIRFRARASVADRTSVALRVWPHEAGLANMHSHVFLQLMEVGRWDHLTRAGGLGKALKNGWLPVVAAQMIRYRSPIRRFTRFELFTQLVHWDEKDLFAEQTFERQGTVLARGVVRLRFPAGRRTTSPIEAMRELWNAESPPPPAWIAEWKAAERA